MKYLVKQDITALLIEKSARQMGERALLSEKGQQPLPDNQVEAFMRELGHQSHRRRLKIRPRRIIIAAIIITVSLVLAVTAKTGLLEHIMVSISNDHSRFEVGIEHRIVVEGAPTWLPKGFEIKAVKPLEHHFLLTYQNGQGQKIEFYQYDECSALNIDTEDLEETKQIAIHEALGTFGKKDGRQYLIWNVRNRIFVLITDSLFPEEDLIKIAESVPEIK